ncbi:MAG: hypothetical protein NC548_06455 [Lachnospiraceae bacterium]|nr:hypothetical protein [Lachnospiraceae bacterium]
MNPIGGYIGLFQPPLLDRSRSHRCSIYCITGQDHQSLVIIPLVPNFFEDAYIAARKSCYQSIELILPALDMIFVSDAFLLFHEVHTKLQKKMNIYCSNVPQLVITDEFSSYVHRIIDSPVVFGEWNTDTDLNPNGHFPLTVEFPQLYRPIARSASDIYVCTEEKRILFCVYMSQDKLTHIDTSDVRDQFDEIHLPFVKTIYGGLKYFEIKKAASSGLLPKLRAYGFQTEEEATLCKSTGGHLGEVRFNDFV